MQKCVLDTNVLLDRTFKSVMDSLEEPTEVIIPLAVLEELDTFKKGYEIKNVHARAANNFLDELRQVGKLHTGVQYGEHIVRVSIDIKELDEDKPDYRIIYTAKENGATLITQDINERVIADALDIPTTHYKPDDVDVEQLYTGFVECDVSDAEIEKFAKRGMIIADKVQRNGEDYILTHNEFLIMKDSQGGESEGIYNAETGQITRLKTHYKPFGFSAKKDADNRPIREQKFLMHLLQDDETDFVSALGPSGIGKTFVALAVGLEKMMKEGKYSKITVMRPLVGIGEGIGFLPGDKREKLMPWMASTVDNLEVLLANEVFTDIGAISGREAVEKLMDAGAIEFEAIEHIRGRSIPNQYIIVDDAQNLSVKEATTIITRAGEGSKLIFLGDLSEKQIDNHRLTPSSNGLAYVVDRLHGAEHVGHISTIDESKVVRSRLARLGVERL